MYFLKFMRPLFPMIALAAGSAMGQTLDIVHPTIEDRVARAVSAQISAKLA